MTKVSWINQGSGLAKREFSSFDVMRVEKQAQLCYDSISKGVGGELNLV